MNLRNPVDLNQYVTITRKLEKRELGPIIHQIFERHTKSQQQGGVETVQNASFPRTVRANKYRQALLGATGAGKTFTAADYSTSSNSVRPRGGSGGPSTVISGAVSRSTAASLRAFATAWTPTQLLKKNSASATPRPAAVRRA